MIENKEWYDYLDWFKGIDEKKLYGDEDDENLEAEDTDKDVEDDRLMGE